MRTLLLVALLLVSNVLPAQRYSSFIKDRPRPARVVNDYGNFLTYSEERSLENELISYRRKTGKAIVIITLSTLPYSVEETALQYFNKWGIGDRSRNNGVLILVSKSPRRARITTGAGIDHVLTDEDCQSIVDEAIVPNFKTGSFFTGFKEAVNDIEAILSGGRQSPYRAVTPANAYSPEAGQTQTATQTQQQPQALSVPAYNKKPMTVGQAIMGILMLALMVWLRVMYVRSKRPSTETYSQAGGTSSGNTVAHDTLSAIGWVLLLVGRIALWSFAIIFGFLAIMFGISRGRSFFRSNAAEGSFGGGMSRGGGASGSW